MKYICFFNQLTIKNVPQVGGKNASLGEMYQKLSKRGVRILNGFATTANAYWHFIKKTGLKSKIKEVLKGLDVKKNIQGLTERGSKIRQMILEAELPEDFKSAIIKAYQKLSQEYGVKATDVAIRSSATAEDLPSASFAGQMESYLNIKGTGRVVEAVKKCFASLFTDRAIVYREEKGFDHFKIALSAGIQKMVRSDRACSGVMFSCDTESGFADVTLINAAYGLGEYVVQGKVNPDEYFVFETTLKKGFRPIIGKRLGSKEIKLVYNPQGPSPVKNVFVPLNERQKFSLTDDEALQLARWSVIIEEHYKRPMDIEWAKDGLDKNLYILQARPETVKSQRKMDVLEEYVLKKPMSSYLKRGHKTGIKGRGFKGRVLVEGISIGSKIGQGKANVIEDVKDITKFQPGQVLVTDITDPDWVVAMKMAKAIVTNSGGRTAHAAIVSRELGTPCIVGTGNATEMIRTGQDVTVSCAEGEKGYVYAGLIPFEVKKTQLKKLKRPRTKIMMNIGEPEEAFSYSFIPNNGIGLAREEFIINNFIKIHPLALMDYKKLKDKRVKKKIAELTYGWKDKSQFFVDKLAEGIGRLGAAFYPKDVIVRFSDFKSNEYANLIGGQAYEPDEANPMLGWRGASRYYSEKYRKAFDLECRAIKKVREVFGLTNIIVMVPFCRTVEEGKKVLAILKENGLEKSKKGFQVFVMCEIPSNVILAEEFAKIFSGFSIGSNDLTQTCLGVDRDSALVAHVYDERNEAVKNLIRRVIKVAHKYKRKIGFCGDAPSSLPGYAEFLVECGIDSMSLTPDVVIKTTLAVSKTEKKLRRKGRKKKK